MALSCPLGQFHLLVCLFTYQLFTEHLPYAKPCLGIEDTAVMVTSLPWCTWCLCLVTVSCWDFPALTLVCPPLLSCDDTQYLML